MKSSELISQMEVREMALNFFLSKDHIEKISNKLVYTLKNCEIFLESIDSDGKVQDVMDTAYFVVRPDEERNCIDIIVTILIDDDYTRSLIFTLYGVKAEKMIINNEIYTSVYEYMGMDEDPVKYKLTIKKD